MTKLLQKAFELASTLPEDEQDVSAAATIAGLEAERRWDRMFECSTDALDQVAEEALEEFRHGKTKPEDTAGRI